MTAIVILAAGASRRMGRPKQLLEFRGATMLRRMVEVARETGVRPIVVVLGAEASRLGPELSGTEAVAVFNPDWRDGMSTSVRVGLEEALNQAPDVDAVLFMVVDQPFVSSTLLEQLIDCYRREHPPLVAARYGDMPGVPAIFDRSLFPELKTLSGDKGARPLFQKYRLEMKTVAFPRGRFDLDTPGDYQRLQEEE